MQKNNYIIGGGITGLIWGFYHPDFQIISPDAGGLLNQKYLVLLHDTPATRKLLSDLGYSNPEKYADICKIGYCNQGFIRTWQDERTNLISIQKKMTEWNKPIDVSFIPQSRDMSTAKIGENKLPILNVDLGEVIKKLEDKVKIQNGFITKITPEAITVKTKDSPEVMVSYDNLISTIAAPFFWKAYGQEREFKYLPITNVQTSIKPVEYDDDYGMIYYDDRHKFSRISKIDKTYFLEFTGIITEEEFRSHFRDLNVMNYNIVKFGRIFKEENKSPQENIIFSGRFAQWEFGITSEHVTKQAQDYKERNQHAT